MREAMALTERTDVISLAGGLPDTSTFPAERFAKLMSVVAAESTARALQYGPTEGMRVTAEAIVEVMAAEGTLIDPENVIVTTGGQQVIDLVCKILIDPGDVIVAEAPTYPGAVPTFTAYQADVEQIDVDDEGMPIDELERTLDRLASEGRRPKFIYTIPNFQNPAGVTMSLAAPPAAGGGGPGARAAGARGQPLRAAPLRGRGAADAVLAGRRIARPRGGYGPRDLPGHVLEDPLARAAGSGGRSRRVRCWRSSTSANREPTCAPRRSRRCSRRRTSPSGHVTGGRPGKSTSSRCGSSTAAAAT